MTITLAGSSDDDDEAMRRLRFQLSQQLGKHQASRVNEFIAISVALQRHASLMKAMKLQHLAKLTAIQMDTHVELGAKVMAMLIDNDNPIIRPMLESSLANWLQASNSILRQLGTY